MFRELRALPGRHMHARRMPGGRTAQVLSRRFVVRETNGDSQGHRHHDSPYLTSDIHI